MNNCPLYPWPLEEHTQDFRFALPDDLADRSSEEVLRAPHARTLKREEPNDQMRESWWRSST